MNQHDNKILAAARDICAAVAILWADLGEKLRPVAWSKVILIALLGALATAALHIHGIIYGVIGAIVVAKYIDEKKQQKAEASIHQGDKDHESNI